MVITIPVAGAGLICLPITLCMWVYPSCKLGGQYGSECSCDGCRSIRYWKDHTDKPDKGGDEELRRQKELLEHGGVEALAAYLKVESHKYNHRSRQ